MRLFYIFMLLVFSLPLAAQEDWEGRGEIEEAEIIIEKDRKIVLPAASRVFEKMPPFELPKGKLGLEYTYLPVSFKPGSLNIRVRPLTIRTKPLAPVRIGNLKLGYGNYQTPFVEASLGNGRNDEYLYNVFLRHRSSATGPVDEKNSGDSESQIDLRGSVYLNEATFSGGVNYQLDQYTFYGYDQSEDVLKSDIEQALNKFNLFGKIEKNDPGNESNYSVNAVFDYVKDKYSATEADFGLNIFGSIKVNDQLKADILADLYMINRKDASITSYNRSFFRLKPYANYRMDRMHVDLGASIVFENDTLGEDKSVRVFPYIHIDFDINGSLQAFGGFKGDVDKMTLKTFLNKNRYLNANVDIFNQIRGFDFYAGVRGMFGGNWNYSIEADLSYFRNRAFFINDAADTSKFIIIYDTESTSQNTFSASLGYDITKSINIGFLGEYFNYSTELVSEAWHEPAYNLEFTSSFIVGEKFKIKADAYLMGGIKSRDPTDGSTIALDAITNIDIGLEYIISDRASIFGNTYNILGKSYQRYLFYGSRELQWIAGLSYSF